MNREKGILIARRFRKNLTEKGFPIQRVFLFGSVARNEARETSDIDIAILCSPFRANRHEENVEFLLAGAALDARIETICLHAEDLNKKHWNVVRDLEREGISV